MVNLIEVFGLVGLVLIFTGSFILSGFRVWVSIKSDFLGHFLTCPMCIGFWVGLLYSLVIRNVNTVGDVLFAGFISLSSYLVDTILERLEKD